MSDSSATLERRSFLKHVTAGAATIAAGSSLGGCASAHAQPQGAPAPSARPLSKPAEGSTWDFSWLSKMTRPHRMAFDTKEADQDMALGQVDGWMRGAKDWYGVGENQMNAVLVLRHVAAEIAVSDAMRTRMKLKVTAGDPMTVESLVERGVIVLACNVAVTGLGGMLARQDSLSHDEGQRQIRAALRPGVYLVPNGIFGVAVAQEAGCGFFRVG
ncbi:MAG TPA: twin-arginine translocation signal domain-containing protein [Gemmatimonadales bacterium]|jgi:intracellular sulfur oxidation DsrE/DsrF family protein